MTATHFPLGYHVECKLRKDKAVLGDACALVSTFLSKMVESILASHPGVTEPQEVSRHSWKYVFYHFRILQSDCLFALRVFQDVSSVLG